MKPDFKITFRLTGYGWSCAKHGLDGTSSLCRNGLLEEVNADSEEEKLSTYKVRFEFFVSEADANKRAPAPRMVNRKYFRDKGMNVTANALMEYLFSRFECNALYMVIWRWEA